MDWKEKLEEKKLNPFFVHSAPSIKIYFNYSGILFLYCLYIIISIKFYILFTEIFLSKLCGYR